ncbi:MAG: nodulation protein NfeD, partial [Archaeoglobaceae archaeon]
MKFVLMLMLLAISTATSAEVVVVRISGEITEGTFIEVANAYEFAKNEKADLILVELDTPGGL